MDKAFIQLLQCPNSGGALTLSEDGLFLLSEQGHCRYPIENGIALLLKEHAQTLDNERINDNGNEQENASSSSWSSQSPTQS